MKNIFIVVPAYDPDEKIMTGFMEELKNNFENILVVNDGSNKKHATFFKKIEESGIPVISNYKNMGKGRAMKNAFNYLLNKYPNIKGCVTCDCDGQHTIKDIKNICKYLEKDTNELVLGVRDFNQKDVPFKSRYGNKITRSIFKNLIGENISDTQTGLRGFSKELMLEFMDINGERYEYETNMLIICKNKNIPIKEIVIDTVYINDNATSHFNPIKDSVKIYKLFSKSIFKVLFTFILNIILFALIYKWTKVIYEASLLSGLISLAIYVMLNEKGLFNNRNMLFYITYTIVEFAKIALSTILIVLLFNKCFILTKILIDIVLGLIFYIINYCMKD